MNQEMSEVRECPRSSLLLKGANEEEISASEVFKQITQRHIHDTYLILV